METPNWIQIPRRHSPAEVVEIKVHVDDTVHKQSPLLIYEYKEKYVPSAEEDEEDLELVRALHKKVDSEGYIKKREYLRSPFDGRVTDIQCRIGDMAKTGVALLQITVPCSHDAVFNGLCGMCGKDVSGIDVSGMPDSRANIDMFHDANGLKVSLEMATNLDADTRNSLWNQKKLSLIIDLDQTIIHADATTDPGFESRLIEAYKGPQDDNSAPADSGDASEATQQPGLPSDIGKFYLPDSPHQYFVKMRPGLREFFERMSKLYEMHIYTMGTRPYANAVARLIDPESNLFNGRILSRDESGSMTEKSLKRLFPVDTSMVVILDDRADVWKWSPNLIRVCAYEFFRGVGDINAGLLPPKEQINESPSADESTEKVEQKQEEEKVPDSTGNHPADPNDSIIQEAAEASSAAVDTAVSTPSEKPRRLVDNDRELFTLQNVLSDLHKSYYAALGDSHEPPLPDVARLLSNVKHRVLDGVTIVFTAVFPINHNTPPHRSDLWLWATSFGARCELELSPRTTHVVAGKPGTEKVHLARRMYSKSRDDDTKCPPIVVKTNWLFHSFFRWERADENDYLWYDEDTETVKRFRELQLRDPRKRRSDSDAGSRDNGRKQPRLETAALQRLRREADKSRNGGDYDSANTTDIEAELERQEAGLQEHEAEVNTFVQNLDWDDLERELMGDSDSDGHSSDSRPQTPEASGSADAHRSHNGSSANLRRAAMKHAAGRRAKSVRADRDDAITDSSDVYGESGSSNSDEGDDAHDGDEHHHEGHRVKRRKTAVGKNAAQASDKRLSRLADYDGSVDISTNTDDSEEDDDAESAGANGDGGVRARISKKLGVNLPIESMIDGDKKGSRRRERHASDNPDEYESDQEEIDAPLFVGIKDEMGLFEDEHGDDESDFENVDGGYNSDGEDDASDDENFDDLINELEEEISSP
ncbi:CTD phosphatase Fcp1 [Coemansia erecta]|uniref:RNA polymerase II subunit A C-terminal domain phosphatase n=1 Tax=Coemansia erecta TaxID=147472 RepID=A0A9W7XRJ1_9FUNG|nr:CTD phosphatase Fcp1 [Coemansia erecta]